ncbi:Hypothetical predicted protein [Mytilus galloprovincialis]|uniref:Myb/SANT-like DNA-binding domain-containing protein n=1 Tax=Mytilus galloprovincialis TaxID=29158 RepID=A0A8B6EJK7_MYTGA|nr:Hypothetical predicted protein [Mytilus galloprovincialis]
MFFAQIESSKSENLSDDDGAVVSLESDDSDSEHNDILILIDPSDEDNREYISQARFINESCGCKELYGKLCKVTNQKKNELWKVLTEEVNALGVCMRSETEVRYQYRNMCRGAKEKLLNNKKEISKTGGGPPPTQLTIAE